MLPQKCSFTAAVEMLISVLLYCSTYNEFKDLWVFCKINAVENASPMFPFVKDKPCMSYTIKILTFV